MIFHCLTRCKKKIHIQLQLDSYGMLQIRKRFFSCHNFLCVVLNLKMMFSIMNQPLKGSEERKIHYKSLFLLYHKTSQFSPFFRMSKGCAKIYCIIIHYIQQQKVLLIFIYTYVLRKVDLVVESLVERDSFECNRYFPDQKFHLIKFSVG